MGITYLTYRLVLIIVKDKATNEMTTVDFNWFDSFGGVYHMGVVCDTLQSHLGSDAIA